MVLAEILLTFQRRLLDPHLGRLRHAALQKFYVCLDALHQSPYRPVENALK